MSVMSSMVALAVGASAVTAAEAAGSQGYEIKGHQPFSKEYVPAKECAVTQENPIDTVFKNYVYNYSCYDDCATVEKQWNREAECVENKRYYTINSETGEEDYVPGGFDVAVCEIKEYPRSSRNHCNDDGECNADEYCSLEMSNVCLHTGMRVQARSTNADNMVIPAGETKAVNFFVDTAYGTVANIGKIHFITSAIANLSYEVTVAPSADVVGFKRTLLGSICESSQVEDSATNYYRLTTDAYLQGDDIFDGSWVYSVTNDGSEDVTLLAVFKDFDTTYD